VIPGSCEVRIDRTTWNPPAIFGLVQSLGRVSQADIEATLNMGVGIVFVLPADAADDGIRLLAHRGLRAWVCGSVAPAGSGTREPVSLFGAHPAG
jgi:phosphoribosylformylglycinamidine cyclo-ligase